MAKNIGFNGGLDKEQKIFAYKTLDNDKGTRGKVEISFEEFSKMVLEERGKNPIFFSGEKGSVSKISLKLADNGIIGNLPLILNFA